MDPSSSSTHAASWCGSESTRRIATRFPSRSGNKAAGARHAPELSLRERRVAPLQLRMRSVDQLVVPQQRRQCRFAIHLADGIAWQLRQLDEYPGALVGTQYLQVLDSQRAPVGWWILADADDYFAPVCGW